MNAASIIAALLLMVTIAIITDIYRRFQNDRIASETRNCIAEAPSQVVPTPVSGNPQDLTERAAERSAFPYGF